jgi:hypothetical protein
MGFKTFHVNSEEVANARPEPKRTIMLQYLAREKERMTKMQYAQQYLAQFLEELSQLFPDSLINGSQALQRTSIGSPSPTTPIPGEYYLGCDIARMGGDESTFEVLEKIHDRYYQRENIMHRFTLTTETIAKILELNKQYDFRKIYIDDAGLGVAVFDQLLQNEETRRKVIGINNASRAVDKDHKRHRKLMKEDLYLNLKRMMEAGQIQLLKDAQIFTSLKSIMCETTENTNDVRIYGSYSHIAEGLIRAAWADREKSLNIYYESI